ncbi:MAG: hypothetical protein IT306_29320 [Chloroflexi bacterium]|nr:hypothetical protein [Chloroflexota bacterium]
MLTGFRVLWRALIHFWDESLLMIRTNVTWFVVSLPLYVVTSALTGLLLTLAGAWSASAAAVEGAATDEGSALPWLLGAMLLVLMPQPASAGVYAIANFVVNEETPEFNLFWRALRTLWKQASVTYVIGLAVFFGLLFNTSFYMSSANPLLNAVAILWLYAIVYWLTVQIYVMPLMVAAAFPPPPPPTGDDGWSLDGDSRVAEPPPAPEPEDLPLLTLYKRAAILSLANPLFSLILLFGILIGLALSSFALPVYPLIVMSFAALIGCRGLRGLREKYFPTELQGLQGKPGGPISSLEHLVIFTSGNSHAVQDSPALIGALEKAAKARSSQVFGQAKPNYVSYSRFPAEVAKTDAIPESVRAAIDSQYGTGLRDGRHYPCVRYFDEPGSGQSVAVFLIYKS